MNEHKTCWIKYPIWKNHTLTNDAEFGVHSYTVPSTSDVVGRGASESIITASLDGSEIQESIVADDSLVALIAENPGVVRGGVGPGAAVVPTHYGIEDHPPITWGIWNKNTSFR